MVCYVQLNEIVMANTDYNIDDNNNILYIIDTDGQPYTIMIDKGNN